MIQGEVGLLEVEFMFGSWIYVWKLNLCLEVEFMSQAVWRHSVYQRYSPSGCIVWVHCEIRPEMFQGVVRLLEAKIMSQAVWRYSVYQWYSPLGCIVFGPLWNQAVDDSGRRQVFLKVKPMSHAVCRYSVCQRYSPLGCIVFGPLWNQAVDDSGRSQVF